jgi:hypothetical protein
VDEGEIPGGEGLPPDLHLSPLERPAEYLRSTSDALYSSQSDRKLAHVEMLDLASFPLNGQVEVEGREVVDSGDGKVRTTTPSLLWLPDRRRSSLQTVSSPFSLPQSLREASTT